uniref:GATOR complex protein NPRL3 n=1 Tax=Moschus moschiferus TaxID=68415 RepID=A0A8C6D434_MOSMO
MGDNTSPISVILVSSGSRGNKLLFRYPFQRSQEHPASQTSKWAPGAASLAVSGEAGYRVVSVLAVPSHHTVLGKYRKVKRSRKRITHSLNMSDHCC